MQDFGFWLEQLQQHRMYQQHLHREQAGEAPQSIIQLGSGKIISGDVRATQVLSPPGSPAVGLSNASGMYFDYTTHTLFCNLQQMLHFTVSFLI